MLNFLLFLRNLNWITVSSLFSAILSVVVGFIPNSPQPASLSLAGLAITLALLALRD
jgi:hypothetical protein